MPLSTPHIASIRWFAELGLDDIPLVGGKNASLGEMYRALSATGVRVPPGFAITADAYRAFLHEAQLDQKITAMLKDLDTHDIAALRQRGRQVRQAMLATPLPATLEAAIIEAYERLRADSQADAVDVAVRSSATAEDLPDASCAGPQETYLNVQGHAALLGGRHYEPTEENPMLGFRGAARYYDPRYRDGFALECQAMRQVRDEMGLTNVKLMLPFCRTVDEGRKVLVEMQNHGLQQGENGLEVYVMCEIPSNVILAADFAEIFDGFSIGSNDLTQLVLGVDRDSAIVAPLFDERDSAVTTMITSVIKTAKAKGRKIGICGQAPSDYPEFAQFLVEQGIDSISLNPDAVLKTLVAIAAIEQPLARNER